MFIQCVTRAFTLVLSVLYVADDALERDPGSLRQSATRGRERCNFIHNSAASAKQMLLHRTSRCYPSLLACLSAVVHAKALAPNQ